MVPASVITAWNNLPESRKATISRLCAKGQPLIFNRWVEAAGLKKFRQDSLVNRKAGTGAPFDRVLFKAEEGHLASDLLVAFFTDLSVEINNRYLELLEAAGNEERETRLKIYASLAGEFRSSPYLRLYLATALWVEGFSEEDLASIDQLAAEQSSSE